MGYRSDVGFACHQDVATIIEVLRNTVGEFKILVDAAEDMSSKQPYTRLLWTSLKYYDTYSDIQILDEIMQFLDDTGHDQDYGFIKIGEEYEDIEHRGSPSEWDLWAHRSIEI